MNGRPLWPPAATDVVEPARSHGVDGVAPTPADTVTSAQGPLVARLAMWPALRTDRARLQIMTGFAVAFAALRFPSFVNGEWGNFFANTWAGAFVLGWMLLVTLVVRTITPRQVLSTWLSGVFVAGTLVDGLGALLDDHITGNAFTAVVVPLLEEVMKIVPVLLFVLLNRRRLRGFSGLDLALLGAASGAGFAMYEDMLWGRQFAAGFDGGWSTLLPSILQEPLLVAGHLVWSATIGAGIGLLIVHRDRAFAWIAGPALIAIALLDHMAINYRGDEYDGLRSALMDGRLAILAMLAGIAFLYVVENTVVRASARQDHLFRSRTFGELMQGKFPALCTTQTSERQFQRLRNAAVFANHMDRPVDLHRAVELAWIEARIVQPSEPPPQTAADAATNGPLVST